MVRAFSVKETILDSVRALVEHPWYFIKFFLYWIAFIFLLFVPICGLAAVLQVYGAALPVNKLLFVVLGVLFLIAYFLALVAVWCAPTKLLLFFHDTNSTHLSLGGFFKLFSLSKLFKLLAVFMIYGTIVTLGFILFVVPGIYLAVKLQLALYYMIDREVTVADAFKKSYAATTGNFWRILAVDIIAALLLQLIITIPVSYLMGVYLYRKLG